MKRLILSLAAAALVAGTGLQPAAAQDAVKGKSIFDANCAACHSVQEQVVGPALKDVHKRRDEKWITSFVKNSTKMIASGDKQAVEIFEKFGKTQMTSFEGALSDGDIKDVIAYVKEESDKPAEAKVEVAPTDPTKTDGATPAAASFNWKAIPPATQLLVVLIGFLLVMVLVFLVMTFVQALPLLSHMYDKPALRNTAMARFIALLRGDTSTITGKHKDILMEDHSYDGIHEFDNDLPPWWKYTFYVTIVFGVAYLLHYHVFSSGNLQLAEYEAEVQQAALLNPSGGEEGNVNEVTNFTALTESAKLEAGKAAFIQNCAACHGQEGQGVVGPNLTDEFWLHGGDVNDVFKVVKYGVTSKGMVAWQKKLSDDQILEVSSYILSLKGSNPANAKAPQGEKYVPKK
ncbi:MULTISPECIES: c-type cytochrome [Rufibacter]|uniref:Cytochrome c oxidase cbb3-type subunit 3 n=1 Tax=Rufibacter quisquiliarum TaxID=1549639 RepID=A0A839GQB7_9BACT|nr:MULTISPECIES: c-type cytochrome [Rufibacter]MBA9078989.1 cytochrome c oxidase cbb3-type subunit 3 [Rufibacter quisquiliarum]